LTLKKRWNLVDELGSRFALLPALEDKNYYTTTTSSDEGSPGMYLK
jgi:hypothetical protein